MPQRLNLWNLKLCVCGIALVRSKHFIYYQARDLLLPSLSIIKEALLLVISITLTNSSRFSSFAAQMEKQRWENKVSSCAHFSISNSFTCLQAIGRSVISVAASGTQSCAGVHLYRPILRTLVSTRSANMCKTYNFFWECYLIGVSP